MSTDQATSNKATLTRFQVVEPDPLIRTPLPIEATGADLLKTVFARLHRAFPDLTSRSRT